MKMKEQNLLIPRRDLLKVTGSAFGALYLGGCGSSQFEEEIYKVASPLNEKVESIFFNAQKVSQFPKSAIEPEGLLINTAEDNTPDLKLDDFRLVVDGLVEKPLSLTFKEIKEMPFYSMIIRHVCVEGWAAVVAWGGVRLRDLAARAKIKPVARFAFFESAGGTYYESWDLASALHDQTLLAFEKNFAPLPRDNGGPLRLASPVKLGYKLSKWVVRVSFLAHLPAHKGYWEDQGYEWFAGL